MATLLAPIFDLPAPVQQLTNLADARIGAEILECSDEFLLKQNACCNLRHRSLSKTSLMSMANGWMAGKPVASATRAMIGPSLNLLLQVKYRHWILIRLFSGNYPASAAVQACYAPDGNLDQAEWISIIENNVLGPSQHHIVQISAKQIFTHVRLNIYPDGGIARFKVYGQVKSICKIVIKC